jgi:pimeloyl-ACP methyl ester carboxylesterase
MMLPAVRGASLVDFSVSATKDNLSGFESGKPDTSSAHNRLQRLAASLLLACIATLSLGALYQRSAIARDKRFLPPPGQLVDIGGYRIDLHCSGAGTPAVILESGFGGEAFQWYLVQPAVAKITRVCSYYRAGFGWSDPSPRPRTSSVIAQELDAVLQKVGIAGPYILVGHSFGGFDVQLYAANHPNQVTGVVLVDSAHPHQEERTGHSRPQIHSSLKTKLKIMSTWVGVPRIFGWCGTAPPAIERIAQAVECRYQFFKTAAAEVSAFDESAQEVRRAKTSLANIPLIVISRDASKLADRYGRSAVNPESQKAWQRMQDELATLSSRSDHIVAIGAGHYIQYDRPDVIIDTIQKMLQLAREAQASVGANGSNEFSWTGASQHSASQHSSSLGT